MLFGHRTRLNHEPWNKGRLIGQKPPLKRKDVWAIRTRLQIGQKSRDLALFNLAIDSKLRGCDLVRLRVSDIAPTGTVASRATIRQRKTGRPVTFEISDLTQSAVEAYLSKNEARNADFLFRGRGTPPRPISTRQYARLVSKWIASVGLDPTQYSTHSLRRTKAALIYRKTGNLRAVQLLLGHSKIESTVKYLGIEVDDAIEIAEKVEI
ncbi:MAG: tyrosine-type recombinase/integrase [Rhodospirillaceae bacterium]